MEKTISPLDLNLRSEGYILREDKVDTEDYISPVKWYDVVHFKVEGGPIWLDKDREQVVVEKITLNGEKHSELRFPIDDNSIFVDKKDALNYQLELNENQQSKNASEMKKKRQELDEIQDRMEILKDQLEAGEKVNSFFESVLEKTLNGEIYKREEES